MTIDPGLAWMEAHQTEIGSLIQGAVALRKAAKQRVTRNSMSWQGMRSGRRFDDKVRWAFRLADLGRVNDWAVERRLWIPSRKQLALMAEFLALNALAVVGVRLG